MYRTVFNRSRLLAVDCCAGVLDHKLSAIQLLFFRKEKWMKDNISADSTEPRPVKWTLDLGICSNLLFCNACCISMFLPCSTTTPYYPITKTGFFNVLSLYEAGRLPRSWFVWTSLLKYTLLYYPALHGDVQVSQLQIHSCISIY